MPGGCCGKADSPIITAGTGVVVSGSGVATDPYVVGATQVDFSRTLNVVDTPSVNMNLTGRGTSEDPLYLSAQVTVKLTELRDISDPGGAPQPGEVPTWVADASGGHFEFQTPPPAPAGATNVSNGLQGIGSVGDPVRARTSGTWGSGSLTGLGSDTTIGLAIYVDAAGNLRAAPPSSFITWANVTGKPTEFTPTQHSHTAAQITDPLNLNVGKINGIKVTSQMTSTTPPAGATVGDVFFFPKGA